MSSLKFISSVAVYFQDPVDRLGCNPNIDEALEEMKNHTFFRSNIDWELVSPLGSLQNFGYSTV